MKMKEKENRVKRKESGQKVKLQEEFGLHRIENDGDAKKSEHKV